MDESFLGLIGIGMLGGAMAGRLLDRGHRVLGFDLDPHRRDALRRMGGETAADAAEVVRVCERVILSLPTGDAATQVLDRVSASLRAGQTIIDTTTGEPLGSEAIAERLSARGVAYLDATVSGSSELARRGDVVVMVGGEGSAVTACRDVFETLARETFHVGPVGSGARMKLATNLVLGLNRAALAEGLAFARTIGLDPGLTLTVLQSGAAYSRAMDAKGTKMVAGDFAPQARLSQHLKDVRLILAEARRAGATTPLSEVHRSLLEAAESAGYGDADNSAVIRAFDPTPP